MSTAKRRYGHSNPLINYHSQKAPAPVTTVLTEISGMSVNAKPQYEAAGAVQKKHAFLEEEAGVYSGHHGGIVHKAYQHGSKVYDTLHHDGAMQKVHAYDTVVGGYALRDGAEAGGVQARTEPYRPYEKLYQIVGAGSHQGGSGALTHQYKLEEDSEDESDSEEEELAYGQHSSGGVENYRGYKQEEKHDSVVQKHGYGEHQHGGDAGRYGANRHYSMIEKDGYGWQKAYQPGSWYDALHQDSTVQTKHGYGEQKAYHQGLGNHIQIHKSCLMPYVLIWKPRGRRRWWL